MQDDLHSADGLLLAFDVDRGAVVRQVLIEIRIGEVRPVPYAVGAES